MKKRFYLTLLFFIGTLFCCAFADEAPSLKEYQKAARRYRFKIKESVVFDGELSGSVLPLKEAAPVLNRFFSALDELGEKFVRRSGVREVVVCKKLYLSGMDCAGVARKNCMFLSSKASQKIVYHELFHIFDPMRKNPEWTLLNDRDFRYRGINYPGKPLSSAEKASVKAHYQRVKKDFSADFVSRYAQGSEVEDRAETFAAMVNEGREFLVRVEKSPVLYRKMLFIIELTGRNSLLGKDYWRRKLGNWSAYAPVQK